MAIMPELSGVVEDFALPGGLWVIRRESRGLDDYGEPVAPIETRILIDPIVAMPLDGKSLMALPEGQRDLEHINGFTWQRLQTARGGTDRMADLIEYDPDECGEYGLYLVEVCEPWKRINGAYWYRAVLQETA